MDQAAWRLNPPVIASISSTSPAKWSPGCFFASNVEDASYIRFSYLQLSYSFDAQKLKKYGLNSLYLSGSANNLFIWTNYTGLDPEIAVGGWGRASDGAKTPRSRSYTLALTIGF